VNAYTKQEQNVNTNLQSPVNQINNPTAKNLDTEEAQKAIKEFAEKLPPSLAREILLHNPVEVRGKEQIVLFASQAEHENAILQIKNELVAFLQQQFNNNQLQFQLRKPYTDNEKLNFLKSKYQEVNELVNKLGLDLV
jgi:hypothetical protein